MQRQQKPAGDVELATPPSSSAPQRSSSSSTSHDSYQFSNPLVANGMSREVVPVTNHVTRHQPASSKASTDADGAGVFDGATSCLLGVGDRMMEFLEKRFYVLGLFIARRPFVTILIALVFVAVCTSGMMQLKEENRDDRLWVPTDSRAQADKKVRNRLLAPIIVITINITRIIVLESRRSFDAAIRCDDSMHTAYFFGVTEVLLMLSSLASTSSSIAHSQQHVELHYSRRIRFSNVIVHRKDFGEAIDAMLLQSALALHNSVNSSVAMVNDGPGTPSYNVTYESKCYRRGANCWVSSPLDVFGAANMTSFIGASREQLLFAINHVEAQKRLGLFPNVPELDAVFGGIQRDPISGTVTGARTLSFFYYLRNEEVLNADNEFVDANANAWEAVYLRIVDQFNVMSALSNAASPSTAPVAQKFASRSFEDEFGKTIDGDLLLLNFAIAIILIYTALMMSRWDLGVLRGTRLSLSLGAVVSVGCAIAASYGFCSYAGFFFSKLMNLLPFLLLGIGVDDAFILVKALDNVPEMVTERIASPAHDPEANAKTTDVQSVLVTRRRTTVERIALAVGAAGPSITVTSLTDFCAFLIGSNTSLPALRVFSIYAAFGILFDYVLQVTLFVAFLALDTSRMARKRTDIVCCFACRDCMSEANDENDAKENDESNCSDSNLAAGTAVNGAVVVGHPHRSKTQSSSSSSKSKSTPPPSFFGRCLARLLAHRSSKAAVLIAFVALLSVGISGAVKIEVQADIDNFIPDDSYLGDWYDVRQAYFGRIGASVAVYTLDFDLFDSNTGTASRLALNHALNANPYVAKGSVNDWFMEFTKSDTGGDALLTGNSTRCYEVLHDWIGTPTALGGGMVYQNDVKFRDPARPHLGVYSSRVHANHVKTDKSQRKVKMMDSLRTSIAATPSIGARCFVYGDEYINWEQYKAVAGEAIRNVSLILGVVFVITFLLLARPSCSTLVFLCIAATVVEIIGFMHYWDLTIDSVTVIMMVLSLGLSVDYVVHIGHAYLTSPDELNNDGNVRMKMALEKQGAAVFNGAFSTWLAVVTLGSSKSYVFITFFKQLFLCTSFGLFHGIIVLPVLLSIVNPKPFQKRPAPTTKDDAIDAPDVGDS